MKSLLLIFFLCFLLLYSCGKDSTQDPNVTVSAQSTDFLKSYYKTMNKFEVSVFYEDSADPYVGKRLNGKAYWDFFGSNIKELLRIEERGISFIYPKTLNEMKKVAKVDQKEWTSQQLVKRMNALSLKEHNQSDGVANIFFTNGFYKSEGEVKEGVLGIYIGGTNHIVIFKEAIKRIEQQSGLRVARFSEQSVLIHEIGHLVGLVNNGVPPVSDHHDQAHGAHCTNDKCVMYWLNEGSSDMAEFVRKYIITGDEGLFDSQCLEDAHSQMK